MKNLLFVITLLCAITFAITSIDLAQGLIRGEQYTYLMGLECNSEDLIWALIVVAVSLTAFLLLLTDKTKK